FPYTALFRSHRLSAIELKSDVADLLSRERKGELTRDEFRTEYSQMRRRLFDLAAAVVDAAENHLTKIDALPVAVDADVRKAAASANLPQSNLRASLEKLLKQKSGNGVVFRCQGLAKRYGIGGSYVIEQLDMELRNGEITGVVGLNGSGKTTLLRMVAGSLEPTAGERQ